MCSIKNKFFQATCPRTSFPIQVWACGVLSNLKSSGERDANMGPWWSRGEGLLRKPSSAAQSARDPAMPAAR
eukprot:4698201-Amphidinium_carterae.1